MVISFWVYGICTSYAQLPTEGGIQGKILDDKTKLTLREVNVVLLSLPDSLRVRGVVTDVEGRFQFENVKYGPYLIKISTIGYKTLLLPIRIAKQVTSLGSLAISAGIDIKEISVIAEAIAVVVKKDTIEFNAGSYKTVPSASVEELLRKLPGMEIAKDGNIKANGEAVTKVTIDGKDFFDTNTRAATQNIPADAVSKVQVIDAKTDESKITGVDKGQREKIVNLVLKEEKRNSWFGSVAAVAGTKQRYVGALSLNRFTKSTQFSIIGGSNNINQGLSSDEGVSFLGGNNLNNSQGRNAVKSGGINFSDSWGKTVKFSGSILGARNSSDIITEQNIENVQSIGTFFNIVNNFNYVTNQTFRSNFRLTGSIDSLTTFILTPSFSLIDRETQTTRNTISKNSQSVILNDGRLEIPVKLTTLNRSKLTT